jgi:threonine aldolase
MSNKARIFKSEQLRKEMMIDLRSDTVTRPTSGMMDAMMNAKVGDDVFSEDPTIIALEEKAAAMFGMEAGLFCPSGTMTNQIAIKVHMKPGDEVICDRLSHIYNYEGGGIASNAGASVRLLHGDRGRFTATDVQNNINPDDVHFPVSRMVSVENTSNKGGGCFWDGNEIKAISEVCANNNLALHLDGARLFNALVETGEKMTDYGASFDSISLCLSKGLGAPVGSLLLGTKDFIKQGRRVRKVFGGGMRQAGFLAAAGIYALDNHIDRLKEDHARATQIGEMVKVLPYVEEAIPVETNIVVFRLNDSMQQVDYIEKLLQRDVIVVPFGPQTIRMTTHLDFTDDMLTELETKLKF